MVVVLLTGALNACGIPDDTPVVARGIGPSAGLPTGDDNTLLPPNRMSASDRPTFVDNFLAAAAGNPEDAEHQVSSFLSPEAMATFKPPPERRVVRLTENPLINPGNAHVQLQVQQVGVLKPNGILEPASPGDGPLRYDLEVQEINGASGLFVTKAPQVMLLSDEALQLFYEPRTIYFWNRDNTALVPDVRYMPRSVTREQQPNQVINWLAEGPSRWLDDVVAGLPDGTKVIGNVPARSGGKLEVNLTGQALPSEDKPEYRSAVDRLRRQLMWSLRPNLPANVELQLKIDHQVQGSFGSNDYLSSNPAYRFGSSPERFCVYQGRIYRITNTASKGGPGPVVAAEVNHDIRTAALASVGTVTYAALVASVAGRPVLRTGSVRIGEQATFRTSNLPAPIGYPSWAVIPTSGEAGTATVLVPAGGRLYAVTTDASAPRPVDWTNGPGAITAVAVAPDGHRVAVVAGGRLYLSVMTVTGNGTQLSAPQPISTQMPSLTAVDWSSEGAVVVAGVRNDAGWVGRVAILEVSIDGVEQTYRLDDLGTARVTQLVAYPANPAVQIGGASWVAYAADNGAYDAFTQPALISAADLGGSVPSPVAGVRPTAPFFLE